LESRPGPGTGAEGRATGCLSRFTCLIFVLVLVLVLILVDHSLLALLALLSFDLALDGRCRGRGL